MKSKRFYHIPLGLTMNEPAKLVTMPGQPPTLAPAKKVQMPGVVHWSVDHWDATEFKRVEESIGVVLQEPGLTGEAMVERLDRTLHDLLPGRDYNVTVGHWGLEHKRPTPIEEKVQEVK